MGISNRDSVILISELNKNNDKIKKLSIGLKLLANKERDKQA